MKAKDIVVYEIIALKPHLAVQETILPQGNVTGLIQYPDAYLRANVLLGALCGAVGIDIAFQDLLAEKLNNQKGLLNDSVRCRGSHLMKEFHAVKREFGSPSHSKDRSYKVWHGLEGLVPIEKHNIGQHKLVLKRYFGFQHRSCGT